MSWSHHFKGPALEVARKVEVEGEDWQKKLAHAGEKALHARALALIVVACHEQKEGWVRVEASGHCTWEGDKVRGQRISVLVESVVPDPATESEAKPASPEPAPSADPADSGKVGRKSRSTKTT